jgi:hypothetical protein
MARLPKAAKPMPGHLGETDPKIQENSFATFRPSPHLNIAPNSMAICTIHCNGNHLINTCFILSSDDAQIIDLKQAEPYD